MFLFAYAALGLIVGGLVFVAMPRSDRMKMTASMLLGIVGGTVGGLIGSAIQPPLEQAPLSPLALVLSIVGALLVSVSLTVYSHRHRHA